MTAKKKKRLTKTTLRGLKGSPKSLREARVVLEQPQIVDCANLVIAHVATGMYRKGIKIGLIFGFPAGFGFAATIVFIFR